ncbi:hypothetical protein [Vibrio albus]|nr:hypothetical protein [Vibrio albus]
MSFELGAVYVSQVVANEMLHEMMYGKAQPKKKSFFSKVKAFFK